MNAIAVLTPNTGDSVTASRTGPAQQILDIELVQQNPLDHRRRDRHPIRDQPERPDCAKRCRQPRPPPPPPPAPDRLRPWCDLPPPWSPTFHRWAPRPARSSSPTNGTKIGGVAPGAGTASVSSSGPDGRRAQHCGHLQERRFHLLGPFGQQQVDVVSTLTALSSMAGPSVFGHPILLTATVGAVAPGAGSPTRGPGRSVLVVLV